MRRIIALLLLMSMLFVLFTGCGKANTAGTSEETGVSESNGDSDSGDSDEQAEEEVNSSEDESDSGSDSADSGSSDTAASKDFLSLSQYTDVLSTLKEFSFVYNTKKDGELTTFSFGYTSLGSESIDGTDTDHLKITQVEDGETKEYECWYNAEWEAVKFKDSEGEKTGMEASLSGGMLTMMTQMYCNLLTLNGTALKADGTIDEESGKLNGTTKESLDLGNGGGDVELYDISMNFADYNRLIGISKINGKKMYVVMETISKDKATLDGMRVTRAVLR